MAMNWILLERLLLVLIYLSGSALTDRSIQVGDSTNRPFGLSVAPDRLLRCLLNRGNNYSD